MKKFVTLCVVLISIVPLFAQTPKSFKYQAIARDNNGDPIINQTVSFRFSILQVSPAGPVEYQETQSATTNEFGLVNLSIGTGTVITGDMNDIYWGLGLYYLKTEMDPAGGTSYVDMGTSKIESVPFALYDGDWDINGDDIILSVPGNVSMGAGIPSSKLSIQKTFPSTNTVEDLLEIRRASSGTEASGMGAGLIFRNSVNNGALALTGRIASILESGGTPSPAGMLFQTRPSGGIMNNALYIDPDGRLGLNNTNPYYQLDINGDFNLDYPGSLNAMTVNANSQYAVAYITNDYAGNTFGLSAGVSSSSAGSSSYGLYGFNYGLGYGVYGINYGSGTGVYGVNSGNSNYGYLGGSSYGAYGNDPTSGNYGYIGSDSYGMFANMSSYGNGDYAIYGSGVGSQGVDGTGYTTYNSIGGVKGYNVWGNPYNFATAGFSYLDYDRCAATFGGNNAGSVWGAMSYQRSGGTEYGGYFTSYTSGSGKSSEVFINNGIGAYGELFGADIHGKVYGAFIEGENYATYTRGTSFHDGLDVHIQENGTSENTALYTSVSTDATIQTSGYATLSGGKANITFDARFSSSVSENEPIIVTVTPMGNSNGVYLTTVNNNGFSVEENNSGKSNITVSYIAIGKRKGYENPQLPREVIAADYTAKLEQGLHNDVDTETNGQGLYYENGELHVGVHPSTIPDPNERISLRQEEENSFVKNEFNENNGHAPAMENK